MRVVVPVAALLSVSMTTPAFAYLDPGTGSMVLQAIVGGMAVAGATVGVYWTKVRIGVSKFLGSKKTR